MSWRMHRVNFVEGEVLSTTKNILGPDRKSWIEFTVFSTTSFSNYTSKLVTIFCNRIQ